ncbi:MAG: GalNAc5-diNAcBac-PP-undecaprenol beta-1,3-glucosyltransferase [Aureispira sp.]|jgi:GalNAc5-diNAcBac-PP-undecaprenol beta-1,3-glucosyltransferase
MGEKKVSIIMATYNRAHFIVETLLAIQNQSYQNWECLIVDDGGKDDTAKLIAPILSKDRRFVFSKRPSSYGKGLPGCRNYGLDKANGDFIIFFDDDDIPHPQNLELCVSELRNSVFQFCRYQRVVFRGDFNYKFDDKKNFGKFEFTQNDLSKMIDHSIPFNSCAIMWSRNCFDGIRFNESLMYAEEWECYSRILSREIKGVSIDKILFYGRKHPNSNTGEFWNNNPVRLNSKKNAIRLITKHLTEEHLLSSYLFNYLTSLALSFRDKKLLNDLINIANPKVSKRVFIQFKYSVYPVWMRYKKLNKKLNQAVNPKNV